MIRWLVCVLASIACVSLSAPASAQSMAMGVYSPNLVFKPEFSRSEINIIARLLKLEDAERDALLSLHEGYSQSIRARGDEIAESLQDRVDRAQALGDPTLAQTTEEETKAWESEAKKFKDTFLDDLKSLLTKEQSDRWPLVEREMRRFKRIGSGRLYGESIDLVRIVEESFPEGWSNPQVIEALASYAQAMDGALKRRDETISGEMTEQFEAKLSNDKPGAERIYRDSVAARIAVRDLNLRYTEQIAAMMSEEQGTKLRRTVFERSYPNLVSPSRNEKYIRAAADLKSLSSAQAEEIRSIVTTYDRQRLALLNEIAAIQRDRQATKLPAQLDASGSKMTTATTADGQTIQFYSSFDIKPAPDDPLTPLNQRRYELDRDTKRKVERVLNAAQRTEVRQPTSDQILFGFDHEVWGL